MVGVLPILFGGCSKEPSENTPIEVEADHPIGITPPKGQTQTVAEASSAKFRVGQIWEIKPLEGQPQARLTILRVEEGSKVGKIVHIALSGISYGNGQTSIPHLPFAESAIERSVTTLEGEANPLPDFTEGYRLWHEAFTAGKGGVFTTSVAEAFQLVTGALPKRQ